MNHKKNIVSRILIVITIIFTICIDAGGSDVRRTRINLKRDFERLNVVDLESALGWIKDCNRDELCCGYYFESDNIIDTPNPKPFSDTPLNIKATQPAFLAQHGPSLIKGDVELLQPGREITSDEATFFRDSNSGKITKGILTGNVNFREHGKLVVAEKSNLDFVNKIYSLDNGVYRMVSSTPTGLTSVWGKAKHAISKVSGVLNLRKATYTTCPPASVSWHLWANRLKLDRNTGRGEAINAFLFLRRVPVFYSPYFSFPIDDRRKSGFLMPSPGYSRDSGYNFDLPYYFNLAPNYDFLFTPEFFSKRGVLFSGLWRYLTKNSEGDINANYIPHDSKFVRFRDSASVIDSTDQNALQALKDSSSGRGLFGLKNRSKFNKNWSALLDVNYASDDYILQDFRNITHVSDRDQLLNRADIKYVDDHWSFLTRLQIFQTLHPITQNNAQDQYKRLPQIGVSGDFPDSYGGLDYRFDSELVNFMHRDDFYGSTAPIFPGGTRFNIMPSISAEKSWLGGYIVPKVQLQTTVYDVHDQPKSTSNRIVRSHPVLSIDSGAIFTRDINLFRTPYSQTLEARLFYLFVPENNQDHVPLFDTYLPAFDFNQLFRTNRFSGIDKVGDANQIAAALTTRLLDDYGQEKFNAGIGQLIAFRRHRVTIDGSLNSFAVDGNLDPLINENYSPVVGKMQYFINPKVSASVDAAWDSNRGRFNTATINAQYANSPDRVLNIWYNYALNGDQLYQDQPINLSRLGFSTGWKIWRNWNIVGNLNYNLSYRRAQSYLYGLEYNSCCWAMRAMHSKNFIGIGANNERNYDSRFYLQILFKGFGGFGDTSLGDIVTGQVSGYRDNFNKRF